MKGAQKVIEVLNSLLADELTAINQYMVHAEMCDNWGYDKLGETIQKRAIEEMKHVLSISEMGHFLNRTLWHNQVALTSSLRPWL